MTTEATALKRYNSLFDNAQYSAIAERVAADLRVPRNTVRVSDCMNAITDTALALCNHSHYADAWLSVDRVIALKVPHFRAF